MPSDPRASSSSSRPSSSSAAKPSSSSSAKPSSSSSSSKPSSSSSSSSKPSPGSSSSSSPSKPTQPTPYISANAWMSFFLFVCLVLIILQGPLGLSGVPIPSMSLGGYGGMPGCNGMVAAAVPWCQPVSPVAIAPVPQIVTAPMIQAIPPQPRIFTYPYRHPEYPPPPQMGGQGYVAGSTGAGGYSWYANPYQPQPQAVRYRQQPISVQYQRPGMQVQVETGRQGGSHAQVQHSAYPEPVQSRYIAVAPTLQLPESPTGPGMANLESAFYPLLVGAIALLVVFDYAS